MPEDDYVWLPREDVLQFEETSALVDVFVALGVDKVRLTGGEPLVRHDLPALVRMLAAKPGLADLALTTNGVLLAGQVDALKAAGLQRVTVSLDTLHPDRFVRLTRFDQIDAVRAGIAAAQRVFGAPASAELERAASAEPESIFTARGAPPPRAKGLALERRLSRSEPALKVDTVVIKGVNDDELVDLIEYGKSVDAEVRFIEYMDVGGATRWSPDRVVSRRQMLDALTRRYGAIEQVTDRGARAPGANNAPADRFRLPDGTIFGIISSTTDPFCRSCDRSRRTADGMWYLCLYAAGGMDLRAALRRGATVDELKALMTGGWRARDDRGAETRLALGDRRAVVPVKALKKDPHLEMHTRGG